MVIDKIQSFLSASGKILLFLGITLFFSFPLIAAPALILKESGDLYSLDRHLDLLEDEQGQWSIEDVRSPEIAQRFSPHPTKTLNLGYPSSVYWVRFQVKNENPSIHELLLELDGIQ